MKKTKIYLLCATSAQPQNGVDTKENRLIVWDKTLTHYLECVALQELLRAEEFDVLNFKIPHLPCEYPSIEEFVQMADVVIALGNDPSIGFSSAVSGGGGEAVRRHQKLHFCFVHESNQRHSENLECKGHNLVFYSTLARIPQTLKTILLSEQETSLQH